MRTGRSGFALTEQGRLVYNATKQLMAEIERFSDFVGSASRSIEGEISVMIDDSFVFEMGDPIAESIEKINRRHPRLNLQIRMTAPDRVLETVLEGTVDLGFTALKQPSDSLVTTPLFEEESGIFCGARTRSLMWTTTKSPIGTSSVTASSARMSRSAIPTASSSRV